MKITYFSIKDYRSISRAELRDLTGAAILIGPNNEGKSNILQGLNACLDILSEGSFTETKDGLRMPYDPETYNWATDYPVGRQQENQVGESVFVLYFSLTGSEQQFFQKATGSALNSVLPIELRFGPRDAAFKILKQGRGGKALSLKGEAICDFVTTTLDYVYIPAVRTAQTSQELVNTMVSRELRLLEKNHRYLEIVDELWEIQKPVMDKVASRLQETLSRFVGSNLKKVELQKRSLRRLKSLRLNDCRIVVDDGAPTLLSRKGDGFQSLTAISLMIGALQEQSQDKDIILLIEEPESHLHPKAIHQLRELFEVMRQENQVIITTHNPSFVNRGHIASNFIVSQNNAVPAHSLEQIRDVLGVRTSDNLRQAALVIVVEGDEDRIALSALLFHFRPGLRKAFQSGELSFEILGGASRLPYSLSLLRNMLCNYLVFLDDDEEARRAYKDAERMQLVSQYNTTVSRCLEYPQSEFEDLLDPAFYAEYFQQKYGVDITHKPFDQRKKWSDRIRFGMTKAGKDWPESEEYRDKAEIANLVAKKPGEALHFSKQDLIKGFAVAVEKKIKDISNGLKH